jgi:hypothetical protein
MAKKSLTAQLAEVRAENDKLIVENYDLRNAVEIKQMHCDALMRRIARLQFEGGRPLALKAKKPGKVAAMQKRK